MAVHASGIVCVVVAPSGLTQGGLVASVCTRRVLYHSPYAAGTHVLLFL